MTKRDFSHTLRSSLKYVSEDVQATVVDVHAVIHI